MLLLPVHHSFIMNFFRNHDIHDFSVDHTNIKDDSLMSLRIIKPYSTWDSQLDLHVNQSADINKGVGGQTVG